MKWKHIPEPNPSFTLIVLLMISTGFISFNLTRNVQALKNFVYYVFNPTTELSLKIIDAGEYLSENLVSMVKLKEENILLRRQLNGLAYLEKKYQNMENENKRLNNMLALRKTIPGELVSARVISRDSIDIFSTITINKGQREGVGPELPVIAFMDSKEALVGKVISIRSTTSKVLLVTDRLSSVPAVVAGSESQGLIEGSNGNTLLLRYLFEGSPVKIGDEIITSGIGEVYPAGLSVGIVVNIQSEKEKYFKQAVVKPNINIGNIGEVFIIRKPKSR